MATAFREIPSHLLPEVISDTHTRGSQGTLLQATPEQLRDLEEALQAHCYFEFGLVVALHIPADQPNHPVKISHHPVLPDHESDPIRATAKIGDVLTYYSLLFEALHDPRFKFSEALSMDMLPIYSTPSGQREVQVGSFYEGHRHYMDHIYPTYVVRFNYGGDSDFTGLKDSIPTEINFRDADGRSQEYPHSKLGIQPHQAKNVAIANHRMAKAFESDYHKIISWALPNLSSETRNLIDHVRPFTEHFSPFCLARSLCRNGQPDITRDAYNTFIEEICTTIDDDFASFESGEIQLESISAVANLVESLHDMHETALRHLR